MSYGHWSYGRRCCGRRGRRSRIAGFLAALIAAALAVTACSGTRPPAGPHPVTPPDPLAARTHAPAAATVVLPATSADGLTAGVARQLFQSAPVVVVSADTPAAVAAAAADARRFAAPLLLAGAAAAKVGTDAGRSAPPQNPPASGAAASRGGPPAQSTQSTVAAQPARYTRAGASPPPTPRPAPAAGASPPVRAPAPARAAVPSSPITPALRTEISSLHPRDVLAVGMPATAVAGRLPGLDVTGTPGALPATAAPRPLSHVAVLVPAGDPAVAAAVTATAQAAGAVAIPVQGSDPRADPAAISALAAAKPADVVAAGPGFGPPGTLAYRVAVAATGVQLPGGGQLVFPGHRLVALYGNPESPALGALGQQDLPAAIARARQMAALYRPLSSLPVVPAFEIIATVALGAPGPEGTYSAITSLATLRPWVSAATAAGFYVVLDLQPGRASLLDQAKMYEPLLAMPNVGLALDSEWKLQPGQLPLHQIGSVSIGEVNGVARWLAGLTAGLHLPQKLLVLHQFRLSMIQNELDLDTGNDDLAIVVHMDGQGTPGVKQETWNAVTGAAPHGVYFGWKNFFVMDHPMLDPQETMSKVPAPVMISYQ